MTKEQAIDLLLNKPYIFGHLIGFKDLTELNNEWIKKLVRVHKDKTIQAHRNSFKTTCVSIAIAILVVLMPTKKIAFIRKTDGDVKEIIMQVQKILRTPYMAYIVKCIYGIDFAIISASQTQITTNLSMDIKGTAQVTGFGIGASVTGKHYDIIFTDDIVNITDRVSRAERERTKLFYQELQNIKNREGYINNTGTPWHKEDAFELMPEPEKYDCYMTGLMSEEEIERKRSQMVPSLFAANYELKHIASEDVIFVSVVKGAPIEKILNANVSHIDAAYGGEDYTAFTIARKSEGKYYLYGRLWHKAVKECIDEIIAIRKKLLAGKLHCETNGDKGYLAQSLREKGEKVVEYYEDTNKYIKIVTHLKGDWENVVFVEGTDEEYINQIMDYNEFAEHDDAPDSAACCLRILHPQKNAEDRISGIW
jgi:hypothetical protein